MMTEIKKIKHPAVDGTEAPVELGDGRVAAKLVDLGLDVDGNKIAQSFHNMATILDGLACWEGVFAYDELAEQTILLKPLPNMRGNAKLHKVRPLREEDINMARAWFNTTLKWWKVSKGDVQDAIEMAAKFNVISRIKHYLDGLPRVNPQEAREVLADCLDNSFGLRRHGEHPDTLKYAHIIFPKWLISAVARAYDAGCKADHILIVEGGQGAGKSTAFRVLCDETYFGDSIPRLESKDAADYVRGKWIIELPELASVSKAEVEQVKAFVTRREEKFRPAYGRTEITYPRRCVFVGTTNRSDYLRDDTGNRRFWPIKVDKIDIEAIARDRDRIWAAAKALYDAGEKWHLTSEEAQLAAREQDRRTAVDPLYEEIAEWLRAKGKTTTCMREVMESVMGMNDVSARSTMPKHLQHSIRGALNAAGFESTGKQITSGDFKGQTEFKRADRKPE